ncbi:MAG: PTS sugar transporter subunit IIA [Myxococcota bacterium]
MSLTVRQVAELLRVSHKTVYRWIAESRIPVRQTQGRYRFSHQELLEWASANRFVIAPHLRPEPDEPGPLPSLADALAEGGIFYRLEGLDREEVLRSLAQLLRARPGVDADDLYERLCHRERLGSTGLGDGVALPHPRTPLPFPLQEASVTLAFLQHPVEFGALDGKPVSALFAILAPSVRTHLHLASRVAFALRDPGLRGSLAEQGSREAILERVRAAEAGLDGATAC